MSEIIYERYGFFIKISCNYEGEKIIASSHSLQYGII